MPILSVILGVVFFAVAWIIGLWLRDKAWSRHDRR